MSHKTATGPEERKMKTTEEMISVMKAYNEGKQIEYKSHSSDKWVSKYEPKWNWMNCDYRVKEEPKYRPYESTEEMIEDFCERAKLEPTPMVMPVIWLKEKGVNVKRLVVSFVGDCVYTHFGNDFDSWRLSELFDKFTYLDGSPVGMEL